MVRPYLLSLLLLVACPGAPSDTTTDASGTEGSADPSTGGTLAPGETSAPTEGTSTTESTESTATTEPAEGTSTVGPEESSATSSTTSTTGLPVDCDAIVLPDPVLYQAVLVDLGLFEGPIPGDLAQELKHLGNGFPGVATLEGAECFPNVRYAHLGSGTITDLSPLAGLHELEFAELAINQIVDLSPLAGLTALRHLELGVNQITDLSPLAGLLALEYLAIDKNPVTSFAPLAGLPLVELRARETMPVDLDGLGELAQLERLVIDNAGASDISPLAGATALTSIRMNLNGITDVSALAGLPALKSVDFNANDIVDVSPLGDHAALEELILSGNEVVDVSPLVGLPALKHLGLGNNNIVDPDPLASAGLLALEWLDLGGNPLKPDIGALVALDHLVHLRLSFTDIPVLHPFAPQTLKTLAVAANGIVDVSPLAGHAVLESLDLGLNQITTLQPILGAPFWASQCVSISVDNNPLAPEVFAEQLPALCAQGESVSWDGGGCYACDGDDW